ncbi:MAG: glutathione S-transferase [Hyphomicrobiaceae bacterium]
MIKIYGRANSINVRKVLWMCEELGLGFAREDWGRGFQPTSDAAFQKVSPFGVVPVIDDDGFILRESNTIVRYLANTHERADLYPVDARPRAIVEQWMDWANTDIYTAVRPVFLGLQVKMAPFKDDAAGIASGITEWTRQMRLLDGHLASGAGHVAGPAFTIADIPVGLIVNRWYGIPFEKPQLPHVSAYYDRLNERPAYRKHGRNGTP